MTYNILNNCAHKHTISVQ